MTFRKTFFFSQSQHDEEKKIHNLYSQEICNVSDQCKLFPKERQNGRSYALLRTLTPQYITPHTPHCSTQFSLGTKFCLCFNKLKNCLMAKLCVR